MKFAQHLFGNVAAQTEMKAGGDSGRALKGEQDWHCWDSFKPFVIRVRAKPCARACRYVFVMREKVIVGSPSQQGKFNKTYLTYATRWVFQRQKRQKKRRTKRPHGLEHWVSGKVILTVLTHSLVVMYGRCLCEQEGSGRWAPTSSGALRGVEQPSWSQ